LLSKNRTYASIRPPMHLLFTATFCCLVYAFYTTIRTPMHAFRLFWKRMQQVGRPDATAKSVHVGRVPVKAAGSRDATCRVRLSGVRTAAAGA
jgi:hypothetical protein